MIDDPKMNARKIIDLINEIKTYEDSRKRFLNYLSSLEQQYNSKEISQKEYQEKLSKVLKDKTKEEWIKQYDSYKNLILDEIEKNLDLIEKQYGLIDDDKEKKEITKTETSKKVPVGKIIKLNKKKREKYLKQLNIDEELLTDFVKRSKKKKEEEVRVYYQLYKSSSYGKISNKFFKKISIKLINKFPEFFDPLLKSLRMSGIKFLSKTYVSMILMTMLLVFVISSTLISLFFTSSDIIIQIIRGIILGLIATIATGVIFYIYPPSVAKQRETAIKNDLPFVVLHMSAVSGSGAKPISVFKTLLSTKEYPGLRNEIKKIVNYVHLFGYDLTTALKAVKRTTPSAKFRDLLDGLISTIESGGDLKNYLSAISEETLSEYRAERKKYVQVIATYSDIYTALLIAAPLLFFVTLAIIQTMGGTIGGLPVKTIAFFGTFVGLPILNIAYYIFVDVMVPK